MGGSANMQLHQQCEDRSVLRYIYYYLATILSDTGAQGISAGGGIPIPNWDALADLDAVGGVTRADVVPQIIEQLTAEASNADVEGMVAQAFIDRSLMAELLLGSLCNCYQEYNCKLAIRTLGKKLKYT